MSWSSGSRLFADIAAVIAHIVRDEDDRKAIYEVMVNAFSEHDCDTLHECAGIDYILDEALSEALDIEIDPEPADSDEDEGDEWPDGGREDFS